MAEKFEAMVKLGFANSRMKDIFDLHYLAMRFEFDSATLVHSINATFEQRKTAIPISKPVALSNAFTGNTTKRTQWKAFLRKNRIVEPDLALKDVVRTLEKFLMPCVQSITRGQDFQATWRAGGPWRKSHE